MVRDKRLAHKQKARERAALTLIAAGLTALILGGCVGSNGAAGAALSMWVDGSGTTKVRRLA
jgi:hypothetical protein